MAILLGDLLAAHGITLEALAVQLDWLPTQATAYWEGYERVGRKVALQIHEAFDIPLEDLFATGWVRRPTAPADARHA